jgi:hypothetical protein
MNKKQLFNRFIINETIDRTLFGPPLMHFAARFAGKTYGEFASDNKFLLIATSVQWNILIPRW